MGRAKIRSPTQEILYSVQHIIFNRILIILLDHK
jgi:hypothetical protein